MLSLSDLERDGQLAVPKDVGAAIKTLAADPAHQLAWRFIIDKLSGRNRLSFWPGAPESRDLMVWFEGRRFVGEWLERIAQEPIPEPEPIQPPARTMTEKARRRNRAQ